MKEKKEVRIVERGSPDALLISKAMSSPTAAELLDSLAAGPKTASELETETHYPLPTIQYHINNLLSANLIEVAGTRYSEKGRKMKIYAASDTLLVISPKLTTAEQIKPVLRRYGIPIAGVSAVCIAGLAVINRLLSGILPGTTAGSLPTPSPAVFSSAVPIAGADSANAVQHTLMTSRSAETIETIPVSDTAGAADAVTKSAEPFYAVNTAADAAGAAGDGTAFVLSGVQTGLLIFFIAAVAVLLAMMIYEIVRIRRSGNRKRN